MSLDAATAPPPTRAPIAFRSALISTAGHCEVACGFCFRADRGHGFLGLSTYMRALSRLREIGVAGVCLTGGEPTHHPELRQLVRLAHQFGMPVSMVTSARTEAEVTRLGAIAHLLQNVTVSADSLEAMTLGRTTRTVRSAMSTLRRIDNPSKVLHVTYWRVTEDECAAIAEQLASAGVQIQLSPVALNEMAVRRAGLTEACYLEQQQSDADVLGRHFKLSDAFQGQREMLQALRHSPEQRHACQSPTLYVSAKGDLRRCPYGREEISVHKPRANLTHFLNQCPIDRVTPECAALCRAAT
jgi:molybdenum cofactor biosynthesis enzyme MoaA